MKFTRVPLLLALTTLAASGCDTTAESFLDHEMKGHLTVDKRQYGNVDLEVNDKDSNLTRFIKAGKKIVSLEKSGLSNYNLYIMDSRRVQLARVEIPGSAVTVTDGVLVAKGSQIHQGWGIRAKRVKTTLRLEYVKMRGQDCRTTDGQDGVTGQAWKVFDYRYDYQIEFLNEATDKPIGLFLGTGEVRSEDEIVRLKDCQPKMQLSGAEEAFQ